MHVNARVLGSGRSGKWHVSVATKDVTYFRGAPTTIESLSFTEPYGAQSAQLRFPKISGLEPFGANSADLRWLRDGAWVSITWDADWQNKEDMFWGTFNTTSAMVATLGGAEEGVVALGSTTGSGDYRKLQWDGRIVSIEADNSNEGVSVQCVGALYVFDNYLTQPFTAMRPTPVENAIRRAFRKANQRHPSGVQNLIVLIDDATSKKFAPSEYARRLDPSSEAQKRKKPYYLKPRGLSKGEKWSGLTTRELGSWNKTLTEFVDPLLKMLRTPYGQYTIRMYNGRQPIMHHRSHLLGDEIEGLVIIDLMLPGVQAKFSHDYTQTLTTVYAKTSATLSGTEYDGQQFSPDGQDYWYKPFAITPWVDGDRGRNNPEIMRREVYDEFQYLQVDEAQEAARRHLAIMGDTGVIADITLDGVDPYILGIPNTSTQRDDKYRPSDPALQAPASRMVLPWPRQLVCPGMRVRLDGMHGQVPGPVCMVTEVTQNPDTGIANIRVDSKFRDYLTVQELRMRNRDALKPSHSLVLPSSFGLKVSDPLIPWSYAKGCGYFPRRSHKTWKRWTGGKHGHGEIEFPDDWYKMAQKYPPKDFPNRYSKIRKANDLGRGSKAKPQDPTVFWNTRHDEQKRVRDDVLLSQAGTIDHVEFICVDEDGQPVKAEFHLSIWSDRVWPTNIVQLPSTPQDMPEGTVEEVEYTVRDEDGNVVEDKDGNPKKRKHFVFHTKGDGKPGGAATRWYKAGTPYPFFKSAWDGVDVFGRKIPTRQRSKMYIGWGNYWEPAGFWPGSARNGDRATGVLVDSTDWQYNQADKAAFKSNDDYDEPERGDPDIEIEVATARVMIYCDSHVGQDIYFMGRLYKKADT